MIRVPPQSPLLRQHGAPLAASTPAQQNNLVVWNRVVRSAIDRQSDPRLIHAVLSEHYPAVRKNQERKALSDCAYVVALVEHAHETTPPNYQQLRRAYKLLQQAHGELSKLEGHHDWALGLHAQTVKVCASLVIASKFANDFSTLAKWAGRLDESMADGFACASCTSSTDQQRWHQFIADVASGLALSRRFGHALRIARNLETVAGSDSEACTRLRTQAWIQPFLSETGALCSSEELARAAKSSYSRHQRMLEAIRHPGYLSPAIIGECVGMSAATAFGLERIFHNEPTSIIGGLAAFGAVSLARYMRSWKTHSLESSLASPPTDAPRFGGIRQACSDALLCIAGAIGIYSLPKGLPIVVHTLQQAAHAYVQFCQWAWHSAVALVDGTAFHAALGWFSSQATYTGALAVVIPLWTAYKLGSLVTYIASIPDKTRAWGDKWAMYFAAGAPFLAADISALITGSPDNYWSHVGQALMAGATTMIMTFTIGVAKDLRSRSSEGVKRIAEATQHAFGEMRNRWNLIITGTLLAGALSPMGGLFQTGNIPENFAVALQQGAAISIGVLGVVALCGVAKEYVPVVECVKRGWEDANRLGRSRTVAVLEGVVSALRRPYLKGRVYRGISFEAPGAGLRTMGGWDSIQGQALLQAPNSISVGPITSATWPETSGTRWERDDIQVALQRLDAKPNPSIQDIQDHLGHLFEKVARTMHPAHMLGQHSFSERWWPLLAIRRAFQSTAPKFPHIANRDFFANLHHMLTDPSLGEFITAEQLPHILALAEHYASTAEYYTIALPLLRVLAMSTGQENPHDEQIADFFAANPVLGRSFPLEHDLDNPVAGNTRAAHYHEVHRRLDTPFDHYMWDSALHKSRDDVANATAAYCGRTAVTNPEQQDSAEDSLYESARA